MDLNTILIILGIVALVALIVHGLWSNLREKSKYFDKENKFGRATPHYSQETRLQSQSDFSNTQGPYSDSISDPPQSLRAENEPQPKTVDDIKISIPNYDMGRSYAEPVKPVRMDYGAPMPEETNVAKMTLEELKEKSKEENFEGINSSLPEIRQQLEDAAIQGNAGENIDIYNTSAAKVKPKQTSGYIQLYLIPEHVEEFNGVKLMQALENLGFIFGEQNMYHRHLDLSIASPVLFSVANLQHPGSFDPYNATEFSTPGIVLFMKIPSPGKDSANLRMMIRAAHTLAEDLSGVILTERQEIFDEKAEQDYLARV